MTELDLRHSLVPDDLIEDLVKTMPEHRGPDLQEDRELPKYDYVTFMNKFVAPSSPATHTTTNGRL